MYIPKHFKEKDIDRLAGFMREFSFAAIVNRTKKRYWATHLPFIVKQEGGRIILKSHMAKANPQWVSFGKEKVLVIFQQPHAYISPKLYNHSVNVPTWNYIAVHVYGVPQILPSGQQKIKLLEETFEEFEKDYIEQWKNLPAEYKNELLENITAFKIKVTGVEGKFKLSQNKTENEREKIISELGQSVDKSKVDIAKYMETVRTK